MNKRIHFLIILVIFLLSAFAIPQQLKNFPGDFLWPVIIDSTSKPGLKRNEKCPQTANYILQYAGKNSDTIYLDKSFYYEKNGKNDLSKYGNPDSLIICVDTRKIISENTVSEDIDGNLSEYFDYESYRVIIFNPQTDTVYIGRGMQLPIKMEALDTKNQWKVIEYPFVYMCGTGLASVFLPGNEVLITSAPRYTGKFKTKLRLRYKNCTSNEFNGSINPEQFKVESDKIRW